MLPIFCCDFHIADVIHLILLIFDTTNHKLLLVFIFEILNLSIYIKSDNILGVSYIQSVAKQMKKNAPPLHQGFDSIPCLPSRKK